MNIYDRYRMSRLMLERAKRVIPLGSQTFSKSHVVYPTNAAPLYLSHGKGGHVWDVDGNEYVDFVNGLLPVILGYDDPDVTDAVKEQISKGVSFSLPTPLEVELAEKLCEIIPCAEMVRFGKNGSDATSGAVRIARAATGRERIAVCGYHGWQDWYIGATSRNKGIPKTVCDLTHKFPYNELEALRNLLEKYPGQFAAIMMEAMNAEEPKPGFLRGVQELAWEHGALFILDEIITGFRFHIGGAQTIFGLEPDLATFGKSMANGYPISAVVGKAKYMLEMEEIFFSSTFGGEAVSLAASLATIRKMERQPVHATLIDLGKTVIENTKQALHRHGLADFISIGGHPSWSLMQFRDAPGASSYAIKSLYLQVLLSSGILSAGSHNMSYSHSGADLNLLSEAQNSAFAEVAEALKENDLLRRLNGPPIEPIFKVR